MDIGYLQEVQYRGETVRALHPLVQMKINISCGIVGLRGGLGK